MTAPVAVAVHLKVVKLLKNCKKILKTILVLEINFDIIDITKHPPKLGEIYIYIYGKNMQPLSNIYQCLANMAHQK